MQINEMFRYFAEIFLDVGPWGSGMRRNDLFPDQRSRQCIADFTGSGIVAHITRDITAHVPAEIGPDAPLRSCRPATGGVGAG